MKIKFLIAALFFSLVAAAQPSNYIKFNTRGRWIAGMFDSTLHVPRFNGSPSLRTGGSSMDGAVAIDTANGVFYFYYNGAFRRANLDTSAYAVTSVYRKTASDSVFYVKGGVHTFAFKDSTGGGSTPTLQQVLTSGSTLDENASIITNGNDIEFQGNNSGAFNILAVNSFGVTTQEGTRFNITTGGATEILSGTRISRHSRIDIQPDSIRILPGSGNLFIDTLTSAVGTKALRYNPTTGLVTYADTTTGGGGITIGTTAITSGTVGRILFEGSGNVVQQSSNLFWNNTDGELDVFGGGNEEGLNLVSTNANYGTHLVFKYNTSTSAAFLKPLYNGGLAIGTDGSGDYIHIGGILGVDGKLKVQGYVYESGGYAAVINTNHATTVGLNVALKVSQTADAINVSSSGGTKLFGVDSSGKILQNTTITAGGTTGNQTIDKPTGTVNIAAAGTTVTVTNNKCTANSIVYAVLRTNDATATGIKSVVPSAGSFVITLNAAATAEVSVGFIVFN